MADQHFSLDVSQSLKQEQVMAPRQLQALEMLQAPIMELQTRITKEMENNPVLELVDDPRESLVGDVISTEDSADIPKSGSAEDDGFSDRTILMGPLALHGPVWVKGASWPPHLSVLFGKVL